MPPSRPAPGWSVGKWIAAILAVAVHLAFVVFLIFSVDWRNREPEPVSVELYAPQAVAPKPAPEPPPEPPKPPPPKPEPEPSKPPPEPPPKAVPPTPTKADIALKEKQEQQRKKEQAERERKEKERVDAEKKKAEEKRLAEVRERQTREAEALKEQAQREQAATAARAADAAKSRANEDYIRRIQAKVKGYVVVPPEIAGNPEAIFEVVQLPTGEIIDAQLRKSSGNRAYDEAVQRAIIKASPLPRPGSPDLFQRSLTLKFRPLD